MHQKWFIYEKYIENKWNIHGGQYYNIQSENHKSEKPFKLFKKSSDLGNNILKSFTVNKSINRSLLRKPAQRINGLNWYCGELFQLRHKWYYIRCIMFQFIFFESVSISDQNGTYLELSFRLRLNFGSYSIWNISCKVVVLTADNFVGNFQRRRTRISRIESQFFLNKWYFHY